MVLGVGIDWAEAFHLVALGHPDEGVIQVLRVEHSPAAVDQLVAQIAALEPDPAEVRVVIETRHGLLVERLLDAGYVVLPVNPDLVARRRGPARKKDDAEDARICCLLALERHTRLRPLIPHGELAAELRAIARDDERAARDQRRLLNRLRHDLISTYPAVLTIAGDDLGAPTILKLLQRWPTRDQLATASRQELISFAGAARHGWPDRLADKVAAALATDHFTPRDYLVRAKADTIRLAATQLLAIASQRRAWERRMGELLVGAPRGGQARQPREDQPGQALPGGKVYLSFPGLGDRLAARVAGEIGDHPQQFGSPNALACYAGKAPVTRRSGRSELVVATRLACNRYLADAVQQWAFCSLRCSGWAREFYDAQRARGKTHHAALRALGNR
jgi:transposase